MDMAVVNLDQTEMTMRDYLSYLISSIRRLPVRHLVVTIHPPLGCHGQRHRLLSLPRRRHSNRHQARVSMTIFPDLFRNSLPFLVRRSWRYIVNIQMIRRKSVLEFALQLED